LELLDRTCIAPTFGHRSCPTTQQQLPSTPDSNSRADHLKQSDSTINSPMPPSIVQQFGSMLSARWNLGKEMQSTPSKAPIHETVTYPRIKVTADNNSCLIPSLAYEHILGCGHIIHTATSNEPCAPNCHHVANARAPKKAQPKGVNREGEGKEFYCDACAETEFEALIPEDATATGAGE
jgi:hypothetical protein